ncbi:TetR/AcrR family transcriptional regulator [Microbacterium sp. NPDC090281]|jgi:AcrR family transcriptional regulator|uniref:TetR/AcrR family transcriptional regulator n=1 Tax=Microbacterium sp. NPDC090281 TaxID=3364208 RepID=UPI0037F9588C
MSTSEAATVGRRERNKQQKLERITAAAAELFAERGIDDVTTQQIAERADVGTGTLFLYAKTKGELLLLVQNAHYAVALEKGRAGAEAKPAPREAIIALLRPIVECNRVQVENGRTYLREMVFADASDAHHGEALRIVGETEEAVAGILQREDGTGAERAAALARIVSAIMFLTLTPSANVALSIDELIDEIDRQLAALLGG